MGNAELLNYQKTVAEPDKKKLMNILSASQRAKDLVGQILLFSRKTELERTPVAVKTVVQEALKLLKASLPSSIEIRLNVTDESIQILADSTQIHQILMNLCTNAHHAMMHRGGVLTIDLSALEIPKIGAPHSGKLRPGAWVRLRVTDSGDGMPPEIIEKIFDPYFSTKEKGVGTGLGLAVVQGIVQSYGGAIDVESRVGEGTSFTIYLPRLESPLRESSVPKEFLALGRGERVLFVDDETMLIDVEKDALEKLGYAVVAVADPASALEIFRQAPEHFDLVITDMTMPQMSGDSLAREMIAARPDIPVILCTGFSESITKERALKAGIADFLMKPVKLEDLARSIRKALDRKGSGGN
jgi:CheY-like chemotaxis protein